MGSLMKKKGMSKEKRKELKLRAGDLSRTDVESIDN